MGLPFSLDQPPAPGYRPTCKVAPAATAGGGGLGGLLDAAASLLGAPRGDPWAEHVREVDVVHAPAPWLTTGRIELAPGPNRPEVALDDALGVEMGFDDATSTVLTGKVVALHALARGGLRVVLADPGQALARLRQNASYEQRSLGDLLRQWAGEAGLTPGDIDAGPRYPFLAIDDRRSLWEWIAHLARHAGLLAWVDGAGELHCKRPGGPPARTYHYGEDLLALAHSERGPLLGGITVTGEGAAGSQGTRAWSWLAKRPDAITASADRGPPERLYQEGALRNQAAVDASATGLAEAATRLTATVTVTVPGSPEIGAGSVFALANCPDGRGDGSHLALHVRHRYAKGRGYLTELQGAAL